MTKMTRNQKAEFDAFRKTLHYNYPKTGDLSASAVTIAIEDYRELFVYFHAMTLENAVHIVEMGLLALAERDPKALEEIRTKLCAPLLFEETPKKEDWHELGEPQADEPQADWML